VALATERLQQVLFYEPVPADADEDDMRDFVRRARAEWP
jgi:hypothetical protein